MTEPTPGPAEQLLLRELVELWRTHNARDFGGRMKPPVMCLHDGARALGQWTARDRQLSLSRGLVRTQPWSVVEGVMRHEMAHQYVHEVMGVREEGPHGPVFRAVCAELGIDSAAVGLPDTAATGPEPRALRRVRRLLALAESPEAHEAEAAMRAARRLMLQHNIAEAHAEHTDDHRSFRFLGETRKRTPAHIKILAGILGQHFFVEPVWVHRWDAPRGSLARALEIGGTPANLDMAAYVYDFLLAAGERLWSDHKRATALTRDTGRRRFLAGVMSGFHEQLLGQRKIEQQEGLVWSGDPALKAAVQRRYRRLVSGRAARVVADADWANGRAEGQRLVLHRPISQGADPAPIPGSRKRLSAAQRPPPGSRR